jgi:urea transporter
MLIKANKSIVAFCVGLSILVTDIILFNSFLLNQSNQSAVGFAFLGIFAPVWKVALSIPIGCVIGLLIDKYIKARQQKEPEVTKPIQ